MRKTFFLACLSCLLLSVGQVQAQTKTVAKSAKKTPVWVHSSESDYIITSALNPNIEAAKNECLENVRRHIIRAVAENVQLTSNETISQKITGSEISDFIDMYESQYKTQAADVPFMTGVSASKIEDYYWEQRQNKKTKESVYEYSIKYPFPSLELKKMVRDFEKRDKEMYDKYTALAAGLHNVSSLEEIDRSISELKPLIDYFFDDTRKNAAKTLQESYRKLYDNVAYQPVENKLGQYTFHLMLDGRPITTSQRINLKSESATELTSHMDGANITVRYRYDNCVYDEENKVTANVKIGGRTVPHDFYFTVKKYEIEFWPEKTVYLTAGAKGENYLEDIAVRMTVRSGYKECQVKSMTLDVPGLSEPLFFDYINTSIEGNVASLWTTWIGHIDVLRSQNNRLNMLRGNMFVYIPEENLTEQIHFALPFQANW